MRATRPEQLYETDFYAWTQAQAKELRRFARTRPNLPLDLAHIAGEIRDLGKSERDAVSSLVQQIIQHLLLIEHSPAIDQRLHWADEIDGFRDQIEFAIRRQMIDAIEIELAFLGRERSIQGVREIDMTIASDHDIVGCVEPLSLVAVRQDLDIALAVRARHAARDVLAGVEPALAVKRVAVGPVRLFAKDADAFARIEAKDLPLPCVTEKEIAIGRPHRPLASLETLRNRFRRGARR